MATIAPFANRIAGDRVALIPAFFSSRSPWKLVEDVASLVRIQTYPLPHSSRIILSAHSLTSSRNCVRKFPYTSLTIMGRELYWQHLSRTFWLLSSMLDGRTLLQGYLRLYSWRQFCQTIFSIFTEYTHDGQTLNYLSPSLPSPCPPQTTIEMVTTGI